QNYPSRSFRFGMGPCTNAMTKLATLSAGCYQKLFKHGPSPSGLTKQEDGTPIGAYTDINGDGPRRSNLGLLLRSRQRIVAR
ncbi:hypothetical protein ACQX3E_12565, partial [Corynebacterium diphtheriae]